MKYCSLVKLDECESTEDGIFVKTNHTKKEVIVGSNFGCIHFKSKEI
ncbi:hypothetical protein M0R04_12120 [Candidatus Dojkabacteria bacterium]|nr:hypothetical protein [Candidatus Dojkabacteria bacterium]